MYEGNTALGFFDNILIRWEKHEVNYRRKDDSEAFNRYNSLIPEKISMPLTVVYCENVLR